jgi:outer membrane protein assembly complex protein YaeT
VQGSVNGPLDGIEVSARVAGEALGYGRLRGDQLTLEARYLAAENRVDLGALRLQGPVAEIAGRGAAMLDSDSGNLDLTVPRVDIEPLLVAFDVKQRIASRASGSAQVRWTALNLQGVAGEAKVKLEPLEGGPRAIPVAASLAARADRGHVGVTIESAAALGATAEGEVSLSDTRALGGEIRLGIAAVPETLRQLATVVEIPATVTSRRLEGSVQATVRLAGDVQNPVVTAAVQARDVAYGQWDGIQADIRATANTSQLQLDSTSLTWREQTLRAEGRVDLKSSPIGLDLTASALGVSILPFLTAAGQADLPARATVTANARITGNVDDIAARLTVSSSDAVVYGQAVGSLEAEARYEKRQVLLDRLHVARDGGTLDARGLYDLDSERYQVDARAQALRFAGVETPAGAAGGALSFTANGAGTLAEPGGEIRLQASGLTLDGRPLGLFEGQATASAGQVRVEGRALSDLAALLPDQDLKGTITANLSGEAPLKSVQDARVSLRVDPVQLEWKGQAGGSDGPIAVDYAGQALAIQRSVLRLGETRVEVEGSVPLDETATSGELRFRGQTKLAELARWLPPETQIAAQGEVALEGVVRGSLKQIDPAATVSITGGRIATPAVEGKPFEDVALQASLRDGMVRIERMSAKWATATLEASGQAPLALLAADLPVRIEGAPEGPARLLADVRGLNLQSLPGAPETISGTVAIHLDAEAGEMEWESVRARLTLPELRLRAGQYAFEQDGVTEIALERGVARVEHLLLRGPESTFRAEGTAGLTGARDLDLRLQGGLDLAILSLETDKFHPEGPLELNVAIRGTAAKPDLNGFLETHDAHVNVAQPPLAIENVRMRAEFSGDRLAIPLLSGSLNGGVFQGNGTARLADGKLTEINVRASVAGAYLEALEGLQASANAVLALRGDPDQLSLSGDVRILEGAYRQPITLERGLLGAVVSPPPAVAGTAEPGILDTLQLNVTVRTDGPIVVDNNLAQAGISLNTRVLGTPARPGLTGRIEIEEGGEVTLGERKYLVDRGQITFTNEQRIEPLLNVQARTQTAGYDITMRAQGVVGEKIDVTFTSDPPLPEPDIVAVLITGRTLEEARGAAADVAKEQLISYLAAGFSGSLTGRLERALGLSQVRIEPALIAAETEPTARLTLGQDITRQFGLIYSMNLRDGGDQIWIARYDIARRFSTRAVRTVRGAESSYRFQFQHDLRFGGRVEPGPEPTAREEKKEIGRIEFTGDTQLGEERLSKMLRLRAGQQFDFFRLRKGLDRIRQHYVDEGFLEARVRAERQETATGLDLTVQVRTGPKVSFVFEGWDAPGGVKDAVRKAWIAGVFDTQRVSDATKLLEGGLAEQRYYRGKASATPSVLPDGEKRFVFEIDPGQRFRTRKLEFPGASGVEASELEQVIRKGKLEEAVYTDPDRVVAALESHYASLGYLDVRVGSRRASYEGDAATVSFPIEEGPRYRVGEATFSGNQRVPTPEVMASASLTSGEFADLETGRKALDSVRALYSARGYYEGEVSLEQKKRPDAGLLDFAFTVQEGRQRVLAEVGVEGNQYTSDHLVRTQTGIQPGDPVGADALSRARRNLYATGAFTLADLEVQPVPDVTRPLSGQTPVRLLARVREVRPFELRYGGFFDTDRGLGGIVDFSNTNMLGGARVIGMRGRWDADLRETRVYFSQPFLRRLPLNTVASYFLRREILPDFITDRNGVSLNEQFRWRGSYTFTAGYRFERVHTFEKVPDPVFPFDIRLRVAPVTATVARESRDDLLDATRGSFFSNAMEWGAAPFGSELSYLKYFGQYFKYVPLSQPTLVPWAGGARSRLVYAGGVRVGLAGGVGGQVLAQSERFFSGGGTTMRGFAQNALGPVDFRGTPVGGNAVMLINNELRFPAYRFLDGVGFVDFGNVFARIEDMRLGSLRRTAGAGVRVRTPYFLLRLDYGFKLDRKPDEPAGQFFFSLGQAF